jgi:predicted nucleic acid-binding protein
VTAQRFFADSWIFLEFFQDDDKASEAEAVLERIGDAEAIVAATVLLEVRYHVRRRFGVEAADSVIAAIESFEQLDVLPVTRAVSVRAADLRAKYYDRNECPLSYADAIHLATAVLTDCERLYTGDPDFAGVDEIEVTVIE